MGRPIRGVAARPLSAAGKIEDLLCRVDAEIREIVSSTRDAPASGCNLGALIARERAAAGLSLKEVAARSGMVKGHIWEMERGTSRNPTVAACAGLARALGLSFEIVCHAALVSVQDAEARDG